MSESIRPILSKLRIEYIYNYRSKPDVVLLSPADYLKFKKEIYEMPYMRREEDLGGVMTFEGMKILISPHDLPPYVAVNPENIGHYMYKQSKINPPSSPS